MSNPTSEENKCKTKEKKSELKIKVRFSDKDNNIVESTTHINTTETDVNSIIHKQTKPNQQENETQLKNETQQQNGEITKNIETTNESIQDNESLPLTLGVLTILKLGTVEYKNNAFHNERYIFPIGFTSERLYTSYLDPTKR